jgi:hypothetical protein
MANAAVTKGSAMSGAIWMIVLSVLLCWLPGIGGLVAGIVGGKISGGLGPAIVAWLLSSILVGVLFAVFGALLTGFVPIAIIAGLGGMFIAIIDSGGRLVG